jgi:ELWxxDGT repeat protein
MTNSLWRRWCNSLRRCIPTGPVSRARPRRPALSLEAFEDRVTPTLTPQLVLDINPGPDSSYLSEMVAIGSTTYFTADDGVNGVELWKSDGTAAGTTLVKDIYPGQGRFFDEIGRVSYGPNSSSPSNLTYVNGTLFFVATEGTTGRELWKSDGTAAGTTLVKDIFPGRNSPYPRYSSYPSDLTNVNGTLFFAADDGKTGRALWKSDGTAAGTTLVKDMAQGSGGYDPGYLTNVNGTLFFQASDGTHGAELWKSDGTAAGTTLVKDIYPGSSWVYHNDYFGGGWTYETNSSIPGNLTNVNGTLFFAARDGTHWFELWKSDGTAAGTTLVKDIFPGSVGSYPRYLTNVNGTLFFAAWDSTFRFKLWTSDGTAAGTTLVKDIDPSNLTNVNGTLFFAAQDGTHGAELWRSDGTATGTVLVKDFNPGGWGAQPGGLTNVNGTLFLIANDGTGRSKLWQSNGTAAGTVPVANLNCESLADVNGTLFLSADDGIHGMELWKLVNDGPHVAGVTVNSGAAQRSTVTTITVTFDTVVTINSGAFSLTRFGMPGGVAGDNATVGTIAVSTQALNGVTVATLTFGGANTTAGSLDDGNWTLTIDHTKVLSAAGVVPMAADVTQANIKRLFGDVNGGGVVNVADVGLFRAVFGSGIGDPLYRDFLDFDGDGVINSIESAQFRARFGMTI